MMRLLLLTLCFISCLSSLSAQTVTSINHGPWFNPFNWDCTCVPVPGYTIIVNHDITLDTDFGYTSGSITVNAGASLIEDATSRSISVGGAGFTNHGTTDFTALLVSSGTFLNSTTGTLTLGSFLNNATFSNQGTIPALDSFYNDGSMGNSGMMTVGAFYNNDVLNNSGTVEVDSFVNNGNMTNSGDLDVSAFYNSNSLQNYKNIFQKVNGNIGEVDSFYNAGTMVNHLGAYITVDSVTNAASFTNYNVMSFGDFTNWGTTYNHDSLVGERNFWNDGFFHNLNGSLMTMGTSFYNGDTIWSTQIAHFVNDGAVTIGDSWFNTDTISGSSAGSFVVQNLTSTSGPMLGSFDFCDLTPALTSPYIDFYTGFVDPNITYCLGVGTSAIPVASTIRIYPNPVGNLLTIEQDNNEASQVFISNSLGQIVLQQSLNSTQIQLQVEGLEGGFYMVSLLDEQGILLRSFKVIKE